MVARDFGTLSQFPPEQFESRGNVLDNTGTRGWALRGEPQ